MISYRIFLKSKLHVGVLTAILQLGMFFLSHAQVQLAPTDQDPVLPELPSILTDSAENQISLPGSITMSASTTSLTPLAEDSLILVELYNSTNGLQWTTKTNWLTGPVSTWYGVTVANGRVTGVQLHNNNLNGTIPASIGNLSALTVLYLYLNNLTGGIPSTLGNISTLQQLMLHDNPLGGEIPASLGNLTSLTHLYIYRNNLTGQIPATLGNLSNLLIIAIHQNDLTGNLEWIGSLTNLTQLYIHGLPNLRCEIPTSIGNLTKLTELYLYNNPQLTGTIPSSLGSCIALQQCWLHNNGLSGQLPGSLANLTQLTHFVLHFNYSITGNVPAWISGLTKMQIISIGDTDLGGSLPSDIGNLSAMTELYIQRCRINGNLPSSLQSAVNLSVVDLKYLNLAALPSFLAGFTQMKSVIANDNQLTEILDFTTHVNKANLVYNVENNKLDFGDLEPHFTGPGTHAYNTFTYFPQADIGTAQTLYWTTGSADTLQVTTPGSLNIYQWQKKDGTGTWQDLSGKTASQLHFSNVSASDSGQYRLKITNQHATALTLYSLPFTVKVTGEILPPDAEGQRICANQTATLTATGTGIISWFDVPAGGTAVGEGSSFVTPVLQANKTYYVSQNVGGTVSDRRDVLVEVDSLPAVTASPDASICSGASATISVSGDAASYQWNNGLGQEQSYQVSPTVTTTYTVTGTGTNGCQALDDVIISVNPLPGASISPSAIEICSGASATLTASGGVIYQWAHGPSGNIIQESPDATTTYTVTVTDSNGCADAAQSTVTVNTQCPAAPEELRAAALLTDQIKLTWVNKATNYTGLNLERKTTGSYALLTSLAAGTTSYIDSALQPGTLYYYRIKSFNATSESIPSNEESEQTFSTDQHHVRNTEVLKDSVTDTSVVSTLPVGERIHSWNYLDGELRPFQQVTQQYSPSQKDVVQPHTYDPLGRTVFQFLPYTISSLAPGELRENALATEQPQFYDGTSTPDGVPQEAVNPFTEVKFEPSPLSRVIESSTMGNDWRMAAGKTIKTQYGTNVDGEVLYWTIVEDPSLSLQAPYYYAARQLGKVTRTDMEGAVTVTYTDKLGRTVLQKSSANAAATVWASTYSIFDRNGNLAYHVTPKVVEQIEGGGLPKVVDAAMLNGLCMQYKYDNRNRMIEKKAPGAEPVYYAYDKWNRLVLSQDGNQRMGNKWAFSKYDEWNRVVMTGITVNADTVTKIRSDYDTYTQRFESRSDTTGNIHGYTNLAQPTSSAEILTVSYYDDYSSLTAQIAGPEYLYKSTALAGLPSYESARTRGLVTASKVKVLGTANDYLNTVSYFDDEQRSIQTVAGNHLGGIDRSSTLFNFAGWITKSNLVHFERDTSSITYIGSANNPPDGGTLALSPAAVTPPANMLEGDLVVMFASGRPELMDLQISEAGGQSWTKVGLSGTNSLSSALFWCRFNGTWSADPSVSYPGGTNTTLVMHVFRPANGSNTWSVEGTPLDQAFAAPATPFTVNLPGVTTIADKTVTLGIWFTGDDNSWGSMSGTGWDVTGLAQYRNIAGTDVSCTFAHNIKTVAGATGNVSKNQTANGGDSGDLYRFTFVETPSGPTTPNEPTEQPITHFSSANNPPDGGTLTLSPAAVTPPASMLAGDLVIMFASGRPELMDLQISEAGGQSWTKVALTGTNSLSSALFWCRFNGTWSADPSVSYPGSTNTTLVMHVFRPGRGSSTWSVEGTPLDQAFTAPATPFTVNLPGVTTIADRTVTLGIWFTGDDNSWGSMSGTGWAVTGLAQYRNIAGTDVSCTFAHNIKTAAGATGDVSKNQTANGGDSGDVYRFTFVETPSGPATPEGSTEQITITRRFDYDHTGRLLRTWHQLDSANEILLSELTYNELGQLIRKELNKEGTEKLQAVDYRHTIQGWLQGINTVPPATGDPVDYYAQEMAYNNTFNSGSVPRMDGYITATKWKNDIGSKDRLYNFAYDPLGRLAGSTYMVNGGSGWNVDNGLFSENNLKYDINGNIQTLDRHAKTDADGKMDRLTYSYGTNSNQLLSVVDSATSADRFKGFSDGNTSGSDYQYDANGNLKQDLNKEIKTISYNALDLPDRIDFADSTYIQYTYDAAGVKLSQAYYGSDTLRIDYIGEFIYLNGQLQLIHTEEGRLLPPEYKNLFANKEANSLEGFDPLENVSLATESMNGQTYVRAISNQGTGTPGVWPIGGTIAVKPGEKYSFKVLGYQRHGTTASLYVWGSSGDIIWPGPALPVGSVNENFVTVYFTVPAGVSQVKLGLRWSNPAVGDTLYINRVALYKTDWEYQYFISDHLGSPRVVLQTNPATHTYTSTMESENLASEEFENIEINNIVPFGSANATPGGNEVLRMNNTYRLGAARSLKVYPGDVVDASVFAYYEQNAGYSKSPNSTIIALLTSALTGGGIATTSELVTGAYESTGNSLFALAPNQGSSKPSAFLNYILFDENFVPVEGKSAPVGDTPMTRQLISVPTIMVKEVGYLYVYLSYDDESVNWVFFDDLKIQHRESAVVQVNAFYPYGLTAYTWVREGEYENRFLFQGKELDSLTNWHDFHARQYDPALGRWFAVDPADQFTNPYMALLNNPISHTDPDGRIIPLLVVLGAAVIGGGINLAINWDNIDNFWQGLGYFGAGAASGALSTVGPGGWVAGGLITGSSNAALAGGDLGAIVQGGVVGGISGIAGGFGGQIGGKFGGLVINSFRVNSPFLSGAVTGILGGGLGGFAGGATGGLLTGQDPWQAGINGMITGAAIGGGIGAGAAGIQAHRNGYNPFTGKDRSDIVYRALRADELNSVSQGKGLRAKNPDGTWTLEEHLKYGSRKESFANDPWISTTRDYDVATGFGPHKSIIRIALNDVYSPWRAGWKYIPRSSSAYHFSIWQNEVSIYRHVPQSAIKPSLLPPVTINLWNR